MPMFGTIGRLRPRPGAEYEMQALTDEWALTIREKIPGVVVQMQGRPAGRPDDLVLVVPMQDEATYRYLAALPEQDAWFRRLRERLSDDPEWDDIAWDHFGADGFAG